MSVSPSAMTRLRFLLLFALIVVACSTTTPQVSKARDEAAFRAAKNGFMDALNALDIERMSSFFADDIVRHGDRWLIRHAHASDFAGNPR